MEHADHNPQDKITSPTGQEMPVVVKGPSCPAAFASWWAEYRNKVAKPDAAEFKTPVEKGMQ